MACLSPPSYTAPMYKSSVIPARPEQRPAKAEVTSSNTVGYQKVNISSGLTILGTPFVDVGAQEAVLNIQAIKPSDTENSGGVSMLRIWNGTSYNDYTYYPADQFGVGEDEVPGWGDDDQNEVHVTIRAGCGVWIQSGRSETLSFQNN